MSEGLESFNLGNILGSRAKVSGYAKEEQVAEGIVYRDFSDDLVGNQQTSVDVNTQFTFGNFTITTNVEGKKDKLFSTSSFGEFKSLSNLNVEKKELSKLISSKKIKLNLDPRNLDTFAYFGSSNEYLRVTLEGIIMKFPASLHVTNNYTSETSIVGDTLFDYSFDDTLQICTFKINTLNLQNLYNLNHLQGGELEGNFSDEYVKEFKC